MKISHLTALEILDSRGYPTVEAKIVLENGQSARSAVPSGASTGTNEALELRDGGQRYSGKGVLTAVANVNQKIAPVLIGREVEDQAGLDQAMIELDGTENKKNLGANAILSVSMAAVKAAALSKKQHQYEYIADLFGHGESGIKLPIPMMNVLNGGKHAQGSSDMQEFMIMPLGAPTLTEAVRYGAEVFHTLGKILKEQGLPTTVGDEGGYAPPLANNEAPLQLIVQAIEQAGFQPGKDIAIALDPAASEFYENGQYHLKTENAVLTSQELVERYAAWVEKYPIVSIEDGLAESDWAGFKLLMEKLGDRVQIMGDDLFVTNPKFLQKGIDEQAANSILIKLNQIGTVSETMATMKLATAHHFTNVVSHRSGETEDAFIADFVTGAGTGQIKTGSLSRSERVGKYNQLIRIEAILGEQAVLAKFPYAK